MKKLITLLLVSGAAASPQTRIDLRSQSANVDFTGAPATRPVRTGPGLPPACTTGELFFLLNTTNGTHLHACTAANSWTAVGAATLAGDVSGTAGAAVVERMRTRLISPAAPQWHDALVWNDGQAVWEPGPIVLNGDLAGSPHAASVIALRSRSISAASPAPGDALIWNAVLNVWEPQAVGLTGGLTVKSTGTPVGARTSLNLLGGPGLITAITDTGSDISIQHDIDRNVVATHASVQSGAAVYCSSSSGSATAYTCSLTPSLTSYVPGLRLLWTPDQDASVGPITLNIDGLGPVPIKRFDGLAEPSTGHLKGGHAYDIWYDGAVFRLLTEASGNDILLPRPACDASLRGRLWYLVGNPGSKDELSVCAMDESGILAWRTIY